MIAMGRLAARLVSIAAVGWWFLQGSAGRAAEPLQLPSVDHSRVVYVYDFSTQLFQTDDGEICIDREPDIWNDHCIERYARRELPFPHRRLRAHRSNDAYLSGNVPLRGVDPAGRAWFGPHGLKEELLVRWIDRGVLFQRTLGRGYRKGPAVTACPPRWPWLGEDMLGSDQGIWIAGTDRIHLLDGGQRTEQPLPRPKDAGDERDLFGDGPNIIHWSNQLYRFGDERWLVRSFDTNCKHPGSFVIRLVGEPGTIVARLKDEFVAGLIHHRQAIHILIARKVGENHPSEYQPARILRFDLEGPLAEPLERIHAEIARLGDPDRRERAAASAYLQRLPRMQVAVLHRALDQPLMPEQINRLNDAIQAIEQRDIETTPSLLDEAPAAKLMLVDRQGRQYAQLWTEDGPTARGLICDGGAGTPLKLPSSQFTFDCQGDDGRIYGHDERMIYVLDDDARLMPIAELGSLAGQEIRVVATHQGLLGLGVKMTVGSREAFVPHWLDLANEAETPLLDGQSIASGLSRAGNDSDHLPVTPGPDGRLWFVRNPDSDAELLRDIRKKVAAQLMIAESGVVRPLSEPVGLSVEQTVWPIARDAAIVATTTGYPGGNVLFHDRGKTHCVESLEELLQTHHARLLEVLPDGAAFFAGNTHERSWLIRLGDSFYVQEVVFHRFENGSGYFNTAGIFRAGQWVKRADERLGREPFRPIVNRIAGIDPATHRILGFTNNWKDLAWIPIASDAPDAQTLERHEIPWAWTWYNQTSRPRMDGAWTLTPKVAERLIEMAPKRKEEAAARGSDVPSVDARYLSDDMPGFRRWTGGGWREVPHTLYGGKAWEDAADGVWHVRVREASVTFPDGRSQLIPLDAGLPDQYRLAIESADAVWLASAHSLTRFRLEQGVEGKQWIPDRRLRLPRFGATFAGPWIIGRDMYYTSAGELFHLPLQQAMESASIIPSAALPD